MVIAERDEEVKTNYNRAFLGQRRQGRNQGRGRFIIPIKHLHEIMQAEPTTPT